jgi:mannose-6-phosphate isomerase-like protein (cupin superfamily)
MHSILNPGDERKGRLATSSFEGAPHGAGVSFFLVDLEPGKGPKLHKHPYAETWIVRAGQAAMIADDEEFVAGPGDIVVVGPDTSHRFTATGEGRLDVVCIHASDRFITEWLEE